MLGFTGLCCTNSFCASSEHEFTDSEAEKVLLTGLPPEVAHCLVPWPHRSALHWKGRCESALVSPAGSQPQQRGVIPVSARVGSASAARSQVLGTSHKARSQNRAKKSMCQHPTMLKAKASLRILVQLAHHIHSLTLPHAKESLTFVSSTWLLLWFSKSGPLPEPS